MAKRRSTVSGSGSNRSAGVNLRVPWTSKTIRGKLAKLKFLTEQHVKEALRLVGWKFVRTLTKKRLSGPATTPKTLRVRTGTLRRSLRFQIKGSSLGDLELRMWTSLPYAKVHEFGTKGAGGTLDPIRPRRAQFLTIPMEAALTPSGVARGSAREVGSQYEDVVFRRSTDDQGRPKVIMYGRQGDTLIPLFRLVKEVNIPPRLGFFQTWDDIARWRNTTLGKALDRAKKDTI